MTSVVSASLKTNGSIINRFDQFILDRTTNYINSATSPIHRNELITMVNNDWEQAKTEANLDINETLYQHHVLECLEELRNIGEIKINANETISPMDQLDRVIQTSRDIYEKSSQDYSPEFPSIQRILDNNLRVLSGRGRIDNPAFSISIYRLHNRINENTLPEKNWKLSLIATNNDKYSEPFHIKYKPGFPSSIDGVFKYLIQHNFTNIGEFILESPNAILQEDHFFLDSYKEQTIGPGWFYAWILKHKDKVCGIATLHRQVPKKRDNDILYPNNLIMDNSQVIEIKRQLSFWSNDVSKLLYEADIFANEGKAYEPEGTRFYKNTQVVNYEGFPVEMLPSPLGTKKEAIREELTNLVKPYMSEKTEKLVNYALDGSNLVVSRKNGKLIAFASGNNIDKDEEYTRFPVFYFSGTFIDPEFQKSSRGLHVYLNALLVAKSKIAPFWVIARTPSTEIFTSLKRFTKWTSPSIIEEEMPLFDPGYISRESVVKIFSDDSSWENIFINPDKEKLILALNFENKMSNALPDDKRKLLAGLIKETTIDTAKRIRENLSKQLSFELDGYFARDCYPPINGFKKEEGSDIYSKFIRSNTLKGSDGSPKDGLVVVSYVDSSCRTDLFNGEMTARKLILLSGPK